MWQPELRSERLFLRPLQASDWDALMAAAADPLIWELHPEPTRWQPEVFRRYFDGGLASGGALLVIDAKSGAILGSSRYTDPNPTTRSVEIGYTFLTRPHWGGAFNRELKTLMLDHAFGLETPRIDTVWFVVGHDNHRSRAAMTKIGGVLTQAPEAPRVDTHVVFRIDRDRWKAPR